MDVFLHLYHQPFPGPGEAVAVLLEGGRGRVVGRPDDNNIEETVATEEVEEVLDGGETESVFSMLSFSQVLTLYSAALREKRVVVLSPNLR